MDRAFLVKLMGDWTQYAGRLPFQPRPSTAHRLHLSSLGALIDVEGTWSRRPDRVDIEQWRHLASLGRDHYVRVVYAGYLVPFGHAASLVKVTERVFEGDPNARIAVLRQRFFILVRERVRRYVPLRPSHQLKGRNFPFTEVEILTRVTPDLQAPKWDPDDGPAILPPRSRIGCCSGRSCQTSLSASRSPPRTGPDHEWRSRCRCCSSVK